MTKITKIFKRLVSYPILMKTTFTKVTFLSEVVLVDNLQF